MNLLSLSLSPSVAVSERQSFVRQRPKKAHVFSFLWALNKDTRKGSVSCNYNFWVLESLLGKFSLDPVCVWGWAETSPTGNSSLLLSHDLFLRFFFLIEVLAQLVIINFYPKRRKLVRLRLLSRLLNRLEVLLAFWRTLRLLVFFFPSLLCSAASSHLLFLIFCFQSSILEKGWPSKL